MKTNFTGQKAFSSKLVHFRKRIGELGIELILKESIRMNGDDSNDSHINVDTTVQEKNITFPTDDALMKSVFLAIGEAKKKGEQIISKIRE